jgi:predicted nucleic acid-binding protein
MILYLGTSSLVKLYVEEEHSGLIRSWVRNTEIVATCRIAYTEMVSAVEKRFIDKDMQKNDYERIMEGFTKDWPHYAIVDFDEIEAARLIGRYDLRRFDALHLSAAKLLGAGLPVDLLWFSSADERLCRAAASEGIRVVPLRS